MLLQQRQDHPIQGATRRELPSLETQNESLRHPALGSRRVGPLVSVRTRSPPSVAPQLVEVPGVSEKAKSCVGSCEQVLLRKLPDRACPMSVSNLLVVSPTEIKLCSPGQIESELQSVRQRRKV